MLDRSCCNDVSDECCNKCVVYGIIICCPRDCYFKDSKGIDFCTNRTITITDNNLFTYTENVMRKSLDQFINALLESSTKDEYPLVTADEWTLRNTAKNVVEGRILKNAEKNMRYMREGNL